MLGLPARGWRWYNIITSLITTCLKDTRDLSIQGVPYDRQGRGWNHANASIFAQPFPNNKYWVLWGCYVRALLK